MRKTSIPLAGAVFALALLSGCSDGGSGITAGFSRFRGASNYSDEQITTAIAACADQTDVRRIVDGDDYSNVDLGLRKETKVRAANDTNGNEVLVLSGNLEGVARDGQIDKVGTWKCIAYFRTADSSMPKSVDAEVAGLS